MKSEYCEDVPETVRTEVQDSDNSVASQKTKKVKLVTNLTEEQGQTMVEWLEAKPIIFNQKLQSYKDSAINCRVVHSTAWDWLPYEHDNFEWPRL